MAWITSGRQSDGSWLCQQCTFHNKAGQKRCSMCDSREPPTSNKRRMKGSLSSRVDIAEGKESISRGKALEMLPAVYPGEKKKVSRGEEAVQKDEDGQDGTRNKNSVDASAQNRKIKSKNLHVGADIDMTKRVR